MNKYLRQGIDLLLFSNVFIALCAVAQAMVTYQLLKVNPDIYILALLFSSTIALYNFSIFLSKPKNPERSTSFRVRWIFSHYRLMITISMIAILSIIPLSLFLSTSSKILLLILAFISIAYNLPLFSIQDKKFGIRNIPGIKLFLIASVWALSCVLLPSLELESHKVTTVTLNDKIILIVNRFLFFAAIAVPFDVRDIYQDKFYELKTIPVLFGEKWSLLICQGFLGAYLILLLVFNDQFDTDFIGLSLTIILCGWLIFKSKWKKNEYYYFLFLDGILILQYLMLILFGSITL